MKRHTLLIFLLAYLAMRWLLGIDPGYTFDVQAYKRWMLAAARFGVERVYDTSDCDYPPVYVYYLYPLGKVYAATHPPEGDVFQDTPLLTFLVKLPPLLMDLALGFFLFWLTRRVGANWSTGAGRPNWPRARETSGTDPGPSDPGASPSARTGRAPVPAVVVAALYLVNPAVVFDTAYWGQPDSIHTFFIMAAFVALGTRSAWPAWVLLTVATLMKPLGAPFFPLLGVASLAYHGFRRTVVGGLAAAATAVVIFLPFILEGNMGATLHRVAGDVSLFPYTSTNAHNFWWLVGAWENADVPRFGPISYTHISVALYGVLYAGILYRGHRLHRAQLRKNGEGLSHPQLMAFVFVVAFGFFMLATHMHENHMFMAMVLVAPLLLIGGPWQRRMTALFFAMSFGVFLNMALHDLHLPDHPPMTWGGPTGVENPHLKRPFNLGELLGVRFSVIWNCVMFLVVLWWTFRPGWLESMQGLPRFGALPPRK